MKNFAKLLILKSENRTDYFYRTKQKFLSGLFLISDFRTTRVSYENDGEILVHRSLTCSDNAVHCCDKKRRAL